LNVGAFEGCIRRNGGFVENFGIIGKIVAIAGGTLRRNVGIIRTNRGIVGENVRLNGFIVGKVDNIQRNGGLVRRVNNIRRTVNVVGEAGVIRGKDCTLTFRGEF